MVHHDLDDVDHNAFGSLAAILVEHKVREGRTLQIFENHVFTEGRSEQTWLLLN